MKITKQSLISGEIHTMEINCTQTELNNYNSGMLLQTAFKNATPDEREFILTGITPDEWNMAFGESDEDGI
jgi:hypothetical protein